MYSSCRDIVVQRWRIENFLKSFFFLYKSVSLLTDFLINYRLFTGKAKVPA